ncbi:MAG: hypothetical protein RMY36_007085 [Nostoc sp. SerVER01]|nr:hypothetical protein [Nostoc sp. SerVER01]MDZ8080986.1 hypothetical protein [Nostoc sp. DcaGUA01]
MYGFFSEIKPDSYITKLLTEQGKSKKLKGKRNKERKIKQIPKLIYEDYLLNFEFLLINNIW